MSFYRTLVAVVAAMGLATAAFAADEAATAAAPQAKDSKTLAMDTTTSSTTTTETTATTATKLNVNSATTKELMKVKGLSSAKAKAIVSYRKKHGEFKSLDELKEVKGFKKMNEKTMQQIQDQLAV